ncbi:thioesterase II family protein [Streptomyces pacificus]|uniref:Thioesterase n=1 Tax=Streptomyces pacificus TaxID=2705029 RepID=A0A6A0AQB0_9ACTN|nr:alpha/beta fold hydrolase [Streptomyces pacificus]GFH34441.1 thioesterase [Streptomyces pacificus]
MLPVSDTDLWLRRFHDAPQGAAPRVVCFPHAGGAASWYMPLATALAPRAEVLAVQYPGRQDRRGEPLVDDVRVLARRITEVVAPLRDRPLVLFGHSMGASVAFEVATALQAGSSDVAHLFVSGRRAPQYPHDEKVHRLDDAGVIAEVRRLAGTDSRVFDDEELVRMVLPAIRGDYRAAETYRYLPGPPLTCPVTALTGDRDPKTTVGEAAGWEERTTGPFRLRVFPGGHFFLAEHSEAVVELLSGETPSA